MKNEVFAFGVVLAVVLLFLLLHRGNVDSPAPAPARVFFLSGTTAPSVLGEVVFLNTTGKSYLK